MGLDRLRRDEQSLGDLPVAEPFGGQRRDPALARGQGVAPTRARAARSCASRDETVVGDLLERVGAAAVGQVERVGKRLPGGQAVILREQRPAQVVERVGELELRLGVSEDSDRLAEQLDASVGPGDDSGSAQREPELSRRSECARELDLLGGELTCELDLSELQRRRYTPGAPRHDAAVGGAERLQALAACDEVAQAPREHRRAQAAPDLAHRAGLPR